jgi:sulfoquinovosidase
VVCAAFQVNAQKGDLGKLVLSTFLSNKNFQLQNFSIKIGSEKGLEIHRQQQTFYSAEGQSFIQAQIGKEKVTEDRGAFFVKDNILQSFKNQSINEVFQIQDTICIRGMLFNRKDSVPYFMKIFLRDDLSLSFHLAVMNEQVNRLMLILKSDKNERIYGLGMQFSHANFKGHKVPIFVAEQGIGRGDQPVTRKIELVSNAGGNSYSSYGAIPTYYSNQLFALNFNNYVYSEFDFSQEHTTKLLFFDKEVSGNLFFDNSLKGLIAQYTNHIGAMSGLPDWAHEGAIIGLQGGSKAVIEKYEKLEKAGAKISGIWIQDWVGQRVNRVGKQLWWNWELDTLRYNDWDNFKAYFQSRNIRILGYINPFLVDAEEKGEFRTNYFQQAKDSHFLVKNEHGGIYAVKNTTFSSGILDLSNPRCVDWVKRIIQKELMDRGFDGWMADYAEALPYHTVLSQSTGERFHNYYPEIWAKLNREAISEKGKEGEIFFFSRAAFTNSPKYATAFWLGDQNTNWGENDGIKSAITALNTSSFLGLSVVHGDVGGYTSADNFFLKMVRSEELLKRWIEFSAFTPLFRTHEGFVPESNSQIYSNENLSAHFAFFSDIFHALHAYRARLIQDHQHLGSPIIRHPVVENEQDSRFWKTTYEVFYLGSDVLIYPVTKEGQIELKVELPNGKWRHIWSQVVYDGGGQLTVKCPLGQPLVFTREATEVDTLLGSFLKNRMGER